MMHGQKNIKLKSNTLKQLIWSVIVYYKLNILEAVITLI